MCKTHKEKDENCEKLFPIHEKQKWKERDVRPEKIQNFQEPQNKLPGLGQISPEVIRELINKRISKKLF